MDRFWNADIARRKHPHSRWRMVLYEVIFESDTRAGKYFDVILILSIGLSVLAVMLNSVNRFNQEYGEFFNTVEWFFTILFTAEYLLRLVCIGRPVLYATSFFGVVDLLAIVPTYLRLLFPGTHFLLVIRVLRVLRVFRVLKLVQYIGEANLLVQALRASSRKIIVFLIAVLTLVAILGSLMYVIEGEENGFTSIPRSMYWAIVTLTTVGYGDISPRTGAGQTLAAAIMIMGYGIIAVPTGIVTVSMSQAYGRKATIRVCHECSGEGHDSDAAFCKYCGAELEDEAGNLAG